MCGVHCRHGGLSFDPMSDPEDEWRNAVWDYVTRSDDREKAAERRHKEVIAALGKVERAMSSALRDLRRAA